MLHFIIFCCISNQTLESTFSAPVTDASIPQLFTVGCPKCGKKVYFNERTVFDDKEWYIIFIYFLVLYTETNSNTGTKSMYVAKIDYSLV